MTEVIIAENGHVIHVAPYPLNDRGCYTVKETATHLVEVTPMIYNDRVVLTPKSCLLGYDAGWCYPKGGVAAWAALLFDPDTMDEPPVEFIKAVGSTPWKAMGIDDDSGYEAAVENRVCTCGHPDCGAC